MESKRFYWYKLQENFLHNDIIEFLIRQPNGFQYFSLFIYLLDLTKNTNGVFKKVLKGYDGSILSSEKLDCETITNKLSNIFNIDTVRCGLEMLKYVGLICTNAEGYMYIFDFDSFVGSESESAKKRREERAKAKAELSEEKPSTPALPEKPSASSEILADNTAKEEPSEELSAEEPTEEPIKNEIHKHYSKEVESMYQKFVVKGLAHKNSNYTKKIDKATVDWLLKLCYKLSSVGFVKIEDDEISTFKILETLYSLFSRFPNCVKPIQHWADLAIEKGKNGQEDGIEATFEAIVSFVYLNAIRLLRSQGVSV